MKMGNTWHTYHTVWLLTVVLLFTSGIGWLYSKYHRTIKPVSVYKVPVYPSARPIIYPTPTVNRQRKWASYKSDIMNIVFTYPTAFKVEETANRIVVSLDYPERPARYLIISKEDESTLKPLLELPIGGHYKDPIKEVDLITTRLPDDFIANTNAKVYEKNMGWEEPGPIRIFIIPINGHYYQVKALYSNLPDSEKGTEKQLDADYIEAFDTVIDTLYITENRTTASQYNETFWKSFNLASLGFTFDYQGYWYMLLGSYGKEEQSVDLYDPTYGSPGCRGDCPVFFMSFNVSHIAETTNIETVVRDKYKDSTSSALTFDTITTAQNITFTKVKGIVGGTYYHLFTIHNNKLYTISVGAGAMAELIDPNDPQTKKDLEKFDRSLNSFRFLE